MPKISGYVKTFKVKMDIKIKTIKIKKSFFQKKAIWIKIEDLKNTELDTLPGYDDRYMKIKIQTCVDKVYNNLNVP